MASKQDIYIIGIGGTGTGALAGLLQEAGHRVRGSDTKLYPPMSDQLRAWRIPVHEGFDAGHLSPAPDVVICGNVVRRDNPEAAYVREHGIAQLSMPEAVGQFGIGTRHSIVIAGTHGKTTTTALAAHLLQSAGRDPGYLIGGAMAGGGPSYHLGEGDYFVVEGDEYDTAYFDKGPKFLHYRARTAVITSLEFDHADIFADVAAVEHAFARLVMQLPAGAALWIWGGATRALALARAAGVRCHVYDADADAAGAAPSAELSMRAYHTEAAGLRFEPVLRGRTLGPMTVPLWGAHSANNALAAIGATLAAELSPEELARGMASFPGVRRRMERRGAPGGIEVVDDFAHHPTAVAATLGAARARWPGRRLWAIFEPRSATSRRRTLEADYVRALGGADVAIVAHHARLQEVAEAERFSPARVAEQLAASGTHAMALATTADIVAAVAHQARAGDVVLVLSNGDFDGLVEALLVRLDAP